MNALSSKSTHALLGPRYSAAAQAPALTAQQRAMRERIVSNEAAGDWEEVPCLCGLPAEDVVVSEVERHGLPYRKCLCTACGLLRVNPRWTERRLARFYAEEYRGLYASSPTRDLESHMRWILKNGSAKSVAAFVQEALASHLPAAERARKVVEIGAGGGWNLAGLPKSWRRIGYDADETYLDAGRRLFEVDLRNGFLGEARKDIGDADAVLLSHVVEHLSDPVAALRDLASALPAQSLMLIEVPGVFRIHSTARDPMVYMQNAHLYTFCAQTLARTCESAGLEVLSVDEWCRLVARRAEGGRTPVRAPDPHLAARVLAYLRRCERAHRFTERVRSVPLIGGNAGRVAAKAWGLAMELSASKPGRSR